MIVYIPAVTLKLVDLVNELHEVTDWVQLGLQLGIPYHELEKIEIDTFHKCERGKTDMLAKWLARFGSKASWTDIVAALVKIGRRDLAERLGAKYCEWCANYYTLWSTQWIPTSFTIQGFQCHLKMRQLAEHSQWKHIVRYMYL